ncbi:unnamed protein product [Dibothriocephalus latus]|uniref:PDZ domain-containing protein n=1 Tax=Dibothriocephalus latus TaxID=60516 RepID=A0A3P7PTA8_DIBLA|nr:unnamed protein product [Dibothriocephalus latus]
MQEIEELSRTTKARGLGISLCGNRDLNQMEVLVCGLRPGGIADLDGRIIVGDQLLELNDHVLYGRSHLNAAPIILSSYANMLNKAGDKHKHGNSQALRFVIRRLPENLANLACPPIAYPSPSEFWLDEEVDPASIFFLTGIRACFIPTDLYPSSGRFEIPAGIELVLELNVLEIESQPCAID